MQAFYTDYPILHHTDRLNLLARRLLKWFDYALLYWRMVSVTLDAVTIVTCLTKRGREKKAVPAEAD